MLSWILMKKLIFHNPQQKNLISYLLQLLNVRNFFFAFSDINFNTVQKSFELQCSENAFLQSIVEKAKFTTINTQRFFGFPIFTQQKIAISDFWQYFWDWQASLKIFVNLKRFFSSLMHQLCRKHQKLTTTNFLLNRSSLTTFFLVIHSEPHFSFIFGAKTSLS